MEDHKIKGGFSEKYFGDEKKEITISWPSKMSELAELAKTGHIMIAGKEFKLDAEKICGWAYRGFSLQHQGAALLTPEQKEKAKTQRKAGNETMKSFAKMERAKQDSIIASLREAGANVDLLIPLLNPAK